MTTRPEAEAIVKDAYLRSLGRDPFPPCYDAGAYDYVIDLCKGVIAGQDIEEFLRTSIEAHVRANEIVRGLYREVLGRDPGPPVEGGPWADPAAVAYAYDFQHGRKTEAGIRSELEASDEVKDRRQRATRPEILDNVIHDTGTGRKDLELGVSLFYAMSPDVSDSDFAAVVDELAAAGIRQVRLAQTFTWDNPVRKANVIPFRAGNSYLHRTPQGDSVDEGVSVDPMPAPAHLARLSERLNLLAAKGIRAQYTIFWGGMQPLFTREGREVRWDRVEAYLEAIARFFASHPEHTLEIINEANHGHHLARLGQGGRVIFLERCAAHIRNFHSIAVITASDGGRQPPNEGDPYFAYHGVRGLDYWNVHFPRDTIESGGIPRWCRGSWHLYQDRDPFRRAHGGRGGYGRSDENIFLQTQEEADRWGYRGATLDWRMYGAMLWVTTMAGAGLTLHTHKGFFCEPGLTSDPIFQVVRAWNTITKDFPWHGASSFNAGWARSPLKSFDGPFKAFALTSGENGRDVLVTILNPREGTIVLDMDRPRDVKIYEITGKPIGGAMLGEGGHALTLPPTAYEHALVMRLNG